MWKHWLHLFILQELSNSKPRNNERKAAENGSFEEKQM